MSTNIQNGEADTDVGLFHIQQFSHFSNTEIRQNACWLIINDGNGQLSQIINIVIIFKAVQCLFKVYKDFLCPFPVL